MNVTGFVESAELKTHPVITKAELTDAELDEFITLLIQSAKTLPHFMKEMTDQQLNDFIAIELDLFLKSNNGKKDNKVSEPKLNKKKHSHQLNHKFTWPMPMTLAKNDLEELMLIKGVAMTAGEMKRGEIMTDENIIFATGAMSAGAMMGVSMIDIDHFENELPQEYVEKYGKEINNPYPPGFIIDAAPEMNLVQPENVERMQVEFIAACSNRHVYEMIKTGQFKGCSVVDFYRKETCDCGTDQTHGEACNKCTIEGSHFMTNTLILNEVPNSQATWVDVVNENDIGTIINIPDKQELNKLKHSIKKNPANFAKWNMLKLNKKNHAEGDLDKYFDEGWIDGKASIVEFLINEKNIPESKAKEMADYLFENPNALSNYQYEWLSAEDLVAWFDHITIKLIQESIKKLKLQNAKLSLLKHNADGLSILKNVTQLGQGEVNYGSREAGSRCMECRWFSPLDPEEISGSGICAIVAGEIIGAQGCDRFEANPTMPPLEDVPTGEGDQPPVENQEEVPPNEDGTCPDGFELNEDETMCVRIAGEDEPALTEEEQLEASKKALNSLKGEHIGVPEPTVILEKDAKVKQIKQQASLIAKIAKLKIDRKKLGRNVFFGRENAMDIQAEYESLGKEIKRLENLKKN